MYISKNIRFLRKKTGLTQEALSKRIGKTGITISDYEKGKSTPPLEVALKFCEIFDVDLNSLVTKDLEKEQLIGQEKSTFPSPTDYRAQYEALKKQYQTLERLNKLQDQRLSDLEWMIRKHAPELAREIGLEE